MLRPSAAGCGDNSACLELDENALAFWRLRGTSGRREDGSGVSEVSTGLGSRPCQVGGAGWRMW